MKKILVSIVAAFCLFAAPVFALEWGGLFNDESKISKTEALGFHQSNALFMWVNAPIANSWAFAGEALYKYNLDGSFGYSPSFGNIFDIDLLKVSGDIDLNGNSLQISAGRFTIADNTGVNFSQCCDGISAIFNMANMNFSVYAGYTGLLNSLNVSILGPASETSNDFYNLCHGYVPVLASFGIPSLFANQSLAVQGEFFFDTGAAKYNRIYANLTLGGPIAGNLFYSAVTSFGFVDNGVMNYSSITVTDFLKEEIVIGGGVSYASGGKVLKPYTTFTSCPAFGAASSPETTGCIVPNIDFIYTSGSLFTNVSVKAPVAMTAAVTGFAGVGADVVVIYNIFSDLQAEIDLSYFKDVLNSGVDDNFGATLKFAISF